MNPSLMMYVITEAADMINALICDASDSERPKKIISPETNPAIAIHSLRDDSFLFQSIMITSSLNNAVRFGDCAHDYIARIKYNSVTDDLAYSIDGIIDFRCEADILSVLHRSFSDLDS